MEILVVSCSLNPESNSRRLAHRAGIHLRGLEASAKEIDLRELDLPLCDGSSSFSHPQVAHLGQAVREADAILIATPVYNFDGSAGAKNMIELTGQNWRGKVVGFLCAAGGSHSYMAPMGLANSLMLDFRCIVLPNFVFATEHEFSEEHGPGGLCPEVDDRVALLAGDLLRLARAVGETKP